MAGVCASHIVCLRYVSEGQWWLCCIFREGAKYNHTAKEAPRSRFFSLREKRKVFEFLFRAASRYSKASECLATLRLVTRYVALSQKVLKLASCLIRIYCESWHTWKEERRYIVYTVHLLLLGRYYPNNTLLKEHSDHIVGRDAMDCPRVAVMR